MRAMIGGCCVCSDDSGWPENPLVYCDGQGCTVAVHKACYGIVTVPPGPWFCRKCESQERSARVRCELCPTREGALKRTDSGVWAHVICALYIPEVRFGNTSTMEPIILSLIPSDRYQKICYLCIQNGREGKSSVGACMQCNHRGGCKQSFHVTCAQAQGLLCEEAGNVQNIVKYCGYCDFHYQRINKKYIKAIPAFKQVSITGVSKNESSSSRSAATNNQSYSDYKEVPVDYSVSVRQTSSSTSRSKKGGIVNVSKPSETKMNSAEVIVPPILSSATKVTESTEPAVIVKLSKRPDSGYYKSVVEPPVTDPLRKRLTTSNFHESTVTVSPADTKRSSSFVLMPSRFTSTTDTAPVHIDSGSVEITALNESADSSTSWVAKTPLCSNRSTLSIFPTTDKSSIQMSQPASQSSVTISLSPAVATTSANDSVSTSTSSAVSLTLIGNTDTISTDTTEKEATYTLKRSISPESASNTKDSSLAKSPKSLSKGPLKKGSHISSNSLGNLLGSSTSEPSNEKNSEEDNKSEIVDSTNVDLSVNGIKEKCEETKVNETINSLTDVSPIWMMGAVLNPTSDVAPEMFAVLQEEIKTHSVFKSREPLVGINLPSGSRRRKERSETTTTSSSGEELGADNLNASQNPEMLQDILEHQWDLGSQLFMDLANDEIAPLLSMLHKLDNENAEVEESLEVLSQRRDRLLAIKARLLNLSNMNISIEPKRTNGSMLETHRNDDQRRIVVENGRLSNHHGSTALLVPVQNGPSGSRNQRVTGLNSATATVLPSI